MTTRERFEWVARRAASRPAVTLSVVVVLAIGGGLLAVGRKPSAGTDTFVSRSSSSFQATADDQKHFGQDSVIVLINESLPNLVETADLARVTQLEACWAGETVKVNNTLGAFTPTNGTPYGGWGSPCGNLMKSKAVQVVYGPGTFLNQAVSAANSGIQQVLGQVQQKELAVARAAYALALQKHMSRKQALAAANGAAQLEQQQQYQTLPQMALQSGTQ